MRNFPALKNTGPGPRRVIGALYDITQGCFLDLISASKSQNSEVVLFSSVKVTGGTYMPTGQKTPVKGVSWIQNMTFYFESISIFSFSLSVRRLPVCPFTTCVPGRGLRLRDSASFWDRSASPRMFFPSAHVTTNHVWRRHRRPCDLVRGEDEASGKRQASLARESRGIRGTRLTVSGPTHLVPVPNAVLACGRWRDAHNGGIYAARVGQVAYRPV